MNNNKKILIDARLLSDKETGISRYTKELINIYIDMFGPDAITVIISKKLKKRIEGVKFIKTHFSPFNLLHFFLFSRFLRSIDFDVYHSMFYTNAFFKPKNKIFITTVHDLMYKTLPGFFSNNLILNYAAKVYYDFLVGTSLKNSDFIISVSNATKSDVKNCFGYESLILSEGVNQLKTIDVDDVIQVSVDDYEKASYFLYVGNNRPHKNINYLKRSYLKSKTTKKLVIVGHDGVSFIRGQKKIIYTGYINDFTLRFLYQNASAFVFPSIYEGFGLPVLEAVNLNTLVLSSDAGSLKEFGELNIQFFKIEDESSLISLLENIDNVIFDWEKKEKLLCKFSWVAVRKQLEDFYKKLA